jgi:hypothetical protein
MAMKCVYLDIMSITTSITKYMFEIGRPSIKSIEIENQGLSGTSKGCKMTRPKD